MRGSHLCRHHGKGGAHKAPRTEANTITGPATEASVASAARRRADKALGLPLPPRGKKAKLKAVLAQQIAEIPIVDKPFEQMNDAERLNANRRLSLLYDHFVLTLPNDVAELKEMGLDPMKILNLKATLSANTKNISVKIDEASLRHVEHTDKIDILMQKLRAVKMPTE
jgi:hypothetical protein